MGNKRSSGYDSSDMSDQAEFDQNASGGDEQNASDAEMATAIALDAEAETERLRLQMQEQQQQIDLLFALLQRKGLPADGQGNGNANGAGKPQDPPIVQQFKNRTRVLKQAYPNTRI